MNNQTKPNQTKRDITLPRIFFALFILLCSSLLQAEVPNRITYQGRLSKSGVGAAGKRIFVARILDASGNPLWSSGNIELSLPATGDFSLVLEPDLTGTDWLNNSVKLEISVDGEKLSPTDSFSSSPYALVAATAATVVDGAITTSKLANDAVTEEKIKDNSVTMAKLAVGSIDTKHVLLEGATNITYLDSWQDPIHKHKINALVIQGTVPATNDHAVNHRLGGSDALSQLDPAQISGTAIVASTNTTQVIQPTDTIPGLAFKGKAGSGSKVLQIYDSGVLGDSFSTQQEQAYFESDGDFTTNRAVSLVGSTITATGIYVAGTMKVLGAWDTKASGTVYQAASDGLVQVLAYCVSETYGHTVYGYTDSSNPPTTIRARVMPWDQSGAPASQHQTFTMPVRKGDYWRVTVSDANTFATVFFIPFGN